MASSLSDHTDGTKTPKHSNPSRKVRVVAKIRGFTASEAEFSSGDSWISVNKPKGEASESVTLSFKEQSASRKESYELDYCYEQNEDNDIMFSREVKPLIPGVLDGCNATVIAFGARGSGKTCLIQGSSEKPGLSALAMAEILSVAEKNGTSISISSYEVYQDHVYDILDPERPVVLVLGDAQGKIRLKGLSQVPVKSILEFNKLYVSGCGSRKPAQKVAMELPRRGHKGLIVHVSSPSETSVALHVGKLNFVDLAGYEDSRRKSIDGLNFVENSKINKSIYAMLNVVHALSATENHVPYRESKLTHLLQDSLGGASRVLMVTCLKPSFCQDSIYMVSLVSRSCQNINRSLIGSTKKTKSLARLAVPSSLKSYIPKTIYATAKKQTISRVPLSDKKVNSCMASTLKGRKLFDESSHLSKLEKASAVSDIALKIETSVDENEKSISNVTNAPECTLMAEKDVFVNSDGCTEEVTPSVNSSSRNSLVLVEEVHDIENKREVTHSVNNSSENALVLVEEVNYIGKENGSPPISERLQELSNTLKSLCSSTPTCIKMPGENDIVEPKTPVNNQGMGDKDRWEVSNVNSPWGMLSVHSTGVKHSLVQEYLSFLNTANKEELKRLKGIGEKRATYILELREESPNPFKTLEDLQDIGLSAKQIKGMMKKEVGGLFN